jgi:hypothetical protein
MTQRTLFKEEKWCKELYYRNKKRPRPVDLLKEETREQKPTQGGKVVQAKLL